MKSNDNAWSGVKDGIKNEITWKSMTTNEVREIKMALNEMKETMKKDEMELWWHYMTMHEVKVKWH